MCANGRGHCSANICYCGDGFVSQGDFFPSSACQVHFQTSRALWGSVASIWGIVLATAFYAILKLNRRTKEAYLNEFFVLFVLCLGSLCFFVVGILEASATLPGARNVGTDTTTTAFFVVSNSVAWLFLVLNPLSRSQTGIGSLALARVKKARGFYMSIAPILVIMSIVASCMPLVPLFGDSSAAYNAVTAFFGLSAISLLVTSVLHIVTLWSMQKDFSKALSSSAHELAPSQRVTIERIAKSTKRVILIPCVSVFVFVPFLIACSTQALVFQVWATLPVTALVGGLWVLRYTHRSIRASALVRDKDKEKTSMYLRPTAEIETNNSSGNAKAATESNSSSMSSGTGKPHGKRKKPRTTFKLKGFKSKPMQLMSQVTEGNSEGTVRFTEVDGVDTMNTSSSRYSRPITLSTKLEPTSPRPGHHSISSVQSTLWEVDINGATESDKGL
jgi:hypothetical protein